MTLNHGYRYRHVLGPNAAGQTVISYLVVAFPHSTEVEWRNRIAAGEILVADEPAQADDRLRPGSVLIWNRPGWLEPPTPRHYDIIYQDENLLAVDKPSGLPTLPGGGFFENTLLHLVRKDFPLARPLHRLGRGTSGLVLFAMSTDVAAKLHREWPQVLKQYLALASGVAAQDEYDIRAPIGPCDHERLGKVHAAHPNGKTARSVARTLQRRPESTLFEVDLHTGRPHQIRIHLAYIGHPLVGDPLYATGGIPRSDHLGLPGDLGYVLHAKSVSLFHPVSGKRLALLAPTPELLR